MTPEIQSLILAFAKAAFVLGAKQMQAQATQECLAAVKDAGLSVAEVANRLQTIKIDTTEVERLCGPDNDIFTEYDKH